MKYRIKERYVTDSCSNFTVQELRWFFIVPFWAKTEACLLKEVFDTLHEARVAIGRHKNKLSDIAWRKRQTKYHKGSSS